MRDLMIDIETMGTRFNAPILAVGAVFFEPETGAIDIDNAFYRAVDPIDALAYGVLDGKTLKWWMAQSDSARAAAMAGATPLYVVLDGLTDYAGRAETSELRVWANGPTFDITILEWAYSQFETSPPWPYRGVRDCRTIDDLARGLGARVERPEASTSHNALDDAIHQARWVSSKWQALRPQDVPEPRLVPGDGQTAA